jgi:predicted MFS family arabinose efflux permease
MARRALGRFAHNYPKHLRSCDWKLLGGSASVRVVHQEFSIGYRRYALGLLFVVYVFNFVDRQILSILLEPIREDIELSDTQLGFLGGIAFALFYATAGVPIARWADTGSRRTIIALGIAVWSGMTALTGMARGFGTLALARIGVGVGEAACSPPAHSLISDFFPQERRATALSIYSLGIPVGAAIGTLIGGWVGEAFGWRVAFMVVGLPGLALALLVRLTLRDPPRGMSDREDREARLAASGISAEPEIQSPPATENWREVLAFMIGLRSFRHLAMAGSLHAFVGYGAGLFNPAYFIRTHGMGLAEISTWFFFIGLTGAVGTFLGGFLGDRFGGSDARWYMWVPAIGTIIGVPLSAGMYLWPVHEQALMFAFPAAIVGPMYLGPTFAITQGLVKVGMRAMASAILLFILNMIGLGLGPWFVGMLSDALVPAYGVNSLGTALLWVVVVGNIWSMLHYMLAARTLREDLRAKDR